MGSVLEYMVWCACGVVRLEMSWTGRWGRLYTFWNPKDGHNVAWLCEFSGRIYRLEIDWFRKMVYIDFVHEAMFDRSRSDVVRQWHVKIEQG